MSQIANIYQWLADGHTLTPLEAYKRFGTLVLHTKIDQLRAKGIKVKTEMVSIKGKRVGRYSLA